MPDARNSLANFLTPGVRSIVREELEREEAGAGQGKLYGMPRLVEDLLSSQPLCFNLFGELKLDLRLRAGDPLSSCVRNINELDESGKTSVVVEDDTLDGSEATLLLLDGKGEVAAQTVTTIGRTQA